MNFHTSLTPRNALLILLMAALSSQDSPAQIADAQLSGETATQRRAVQSQSTLKYWVFFTDKTVQSSKRTEVLVSQATIDRRRIRGSVKTERRARQLDQPVSVDYVNALEQLNVHAVRESRWLNAVSVVLSPEQKHTIERLPFVQSLRPVGSVVPGSADVRVVESQDHNLSSGVTRQANIVDLFALPAAPSAVRPATRLDYGQSLTQLQLMNAVDPIERGYIGTGVVLGFLDTEFDTLTHPTFANLKNESRLLGTQFFTPGPQGNRHGVSVASTAVGYTPGQLIGPAYGASVLLATTEYAPSETNQEEDAFVEGMEWLESQGVDVVNSSLGYTTFDASQISYTIEDLDGNTGITTRIVDIAVSLGVVVVNSAGNDGCASPDQCWYYIGTPADADSVISVGAVTSTGAKASFSSFGPTADGRTKPEVSAMGQSVYLAIGPGYAASNGTSFSSPLVAAVACQILQANPDLTPVQVRQILMSTASQASDPDNSIGWGIVDAGAAVDLALSMRELGTSDETNDIVEAGLQIKSVYPNPTNSVATVVIASTGNREITIELYDTIGRRVYQEGNIRIQSGDNSVELPTTNLGTGLYTVRVSFDKFDQFRRLAVIN